MNTKLPDLKWQKIVKKWPKHHMGVQSDFRCLQTHLKKNGPILPFSNLVFWPKMHKKTQKKIFLRFWSIIIFKNLPWHQILAHLAFKRSQRSKRYTFENIKWSLCVWSHYTLLNLGKNLATRGPFGPSLRSVLIIKYMKQY